MPSLKVYDETSQEWKKVVIGEVTNTGAASGTNLMLEYIVPSTCQEFTLSNLDSNSWAGMYVELMLVRPVTGQIGIDMYINSDETYSKYAFKLITFGTSSGSPSVYGSSGSFGSAQIYTDGAPNGNVNTIGGCMIDIMHLNDTVGYISRQILSPVGYYQQIEVKYVNTATVDNITSLKFKAYSAGNIGAGTRVRVYSKKTNISSTQDQTQSVIDLTNASSDYPLQVGQTATLTYTSATSVPLHVATVEGVYELLLASNLDTAITSSNSVALLPNNTTITTATFSEYGVTASPLNVPTSSTTPWGWQDGASTDMCIAHGLPAKAEASLTTYTKSKSSVSRHVSLYGTTSKRDTMQSCIWRDTTTVWSSLGTITFPFAQSGKIIIKRLA